MKVRIPHFRSQHVFCELDETGNQKNRPERQLPGVLILSEFRLKFFLNFPAIAGEGPAPSENSTGENIFLLP